MFVGRFWMIIPTMAIAGSLAAKKIDARFGRHVPDRPAACSSACVVGVILIVGGLTFFPALALGPIVEHLAMNAGTLFSTRFERQFDGNLTPAQELPGIGRCPTRKIVLAGHRLRLRQARSRAC